MRTVRITGVAVVGAVLLAGCGGGGSSEETTSPGDPIVVGDDESTSGEAGATDEQDGGESGTGSDQGSGDQGAQTPADADLREVSVGFAVADALQVSADEVGADSVVYSIDLDYSEHYSAWVWSIDTQVDGTDHDVEIDADTGEVLDHEQEGSDDRVEAVDPTDPMTPEQAIEFASAEVDGPVRSWQLEWDDGQRTYQVEVTTGGDEVDVVVDVATGDVSVDD